FLSQAGGTLAAGLLLAAWGSPKVLFTSGLVFAGGFLIFSLLFREKPEEGVPESNNDVNSGRGLSLGMNKNLWVITVAAAVMMFGISISHCFIMPLFFARKFHADESLVGIVMTAHRLSLGVPLLFFSGRLYGRNLKGLYMASVAVQGLTTLASSLIPHFWIASGVWLLHDLLGAGVWVPIQSTLIQVYARNDSRGLDVGTSLALSSLGGVVGPYMAGWLASASISAPFFVSGLITLAAVPIIMLLRVHPQELPSKSAEGVWERGVRTALSGGRKQR
ncbi:MAG: MFS transporter, partial [Armatimonadota bacterium]